LQTGPPGDPLVGGGGVCGGCVAAVGQCIGEHVHQEGRAAICLGNSLWRHELEQWPGKLTTDGGVQVGGHVVVDGSTAVPDQDTFSIAVSVSQMIFVEPGVLRQI
jgi:hypothetical protein